MPFGPHSKAVAAPIAPYDDRIYLKPQAGVGLCRFRQGTLRWMLILCFTLSGSMVFGLTSPQTTANNSAPGQVAAPHNKAVHPGHTTRTRHWHRQKKTAIEPAPAAVVTPPVPIPPAHQTASPARVAFVQGKLQINASNSSLVEILNQISRQTGLAIEGLNQDKRIYGQYGPGSVSSTLNALLDGAGYNYVIIGGGANRLPQKLILTPGSSGPEPVSAAASSSPVATPAPEVANPSEPPHPKTPQEIFDELRRMHPQHPQ